MLEAKTRQLMESLAARTLSAELPEYVGKLIAAIQSAPKSPSDTRGSVISADPRGSFAERALFTLTCAQIQYNNPEIGIATSTNEYSATASPVDIVHVLDQRQFPHVLVHEGYIMVDGNDNISQMQHTGIFGNPSDTEPTYVKILDSRMLASSPRPRRENPITLYIDADTLKQSRTIYADTEPLLGYFPSDKLGEAFYFFRGIPAEAIIGISTKSGSTQLISH